MNAVILQKCFEYYTDMRLVLGSIENIVTQYNWMITDCECNSYPDSRIWLNQEYAWLSGEELLQIIKCHEIQFIWAVFSAFTKDITLEKVLQSELPYADNNEGFWQNPVGMQHPLAVMEIVPWDSSLLLFLAKDRIIADMFASSFPLAEDLEKYNIK